MHSIFRDEVDYYCSLEDGNESDESKDDAILEFDKDGLTCIHAIEQEWVTGGHYGTPSPSAGCFGGSNIEHRESDVLIACRRSEVHLSREERPLLTDGLGLLDPTQPTFWEIIHILVRLHVFSFSV